MNPKLDFCPDQPERNRMYQSQRVAKVLLYNLYTVSQLIKVPDFFWQQFHNSKKRASESWPRDWESQKKVKGESPSYRLIFLRRNSDGDSGQESSHLWLLEILLNYPGYEIPTYSNHSNAWVWVGNQLFLYRPQKYHVLVGPLLLISFGHFWK